MQSVDRISYAQRQRLEDFADELKALAGKSDASGSQLRQELTNTLNLSAGAIESRLADNAAQFQLYFESSSRKLADFDQANQAAAQQARAELSGTLKDFKDSLQKQMYEMAALQKQHFDTFATQLANLTEKNEKKVGRASRACGAKARAAST